MLVPPNPGITSALGCLLVDIRHDLSEMFLRRPPTVDGASARGARSSSSRTRRASCSTPRACPRTQMSPQRTIAMRYLGQWRSLGRGLGRRRARSTRRRALPRRARARVHLPPRRRAGRDLPAQLARGRRDRGSRSCRRHDAERRRARSRAEPRAVYFERGERASTRPSTSATTCRPARLRGPGGDRPARHHDARPARRDRPRSTSG